MECTLHIKRDSKDVLNVLYILNMKGTGALAADILWELKEELHEHNKGVQESEEFFSN